MVRWRRADSDSEDDDDLAAERAVWLRAPQEAAPQPSSTWDAAEQDTYSEPRSRSRTDGYPPRHEQPAPQPVGDLNDGYGGYDRSGYERSGYERSGYERSGYERPGYERPGYERPGYATEGFGEMPDSPEPRDAGPGLDGPPRRRRLVPLLAVSAVLAVLCAVGYGFLTGPPEDDTAAPQGPPTGTRSPTTPISFQPVLPTLTSTVAPGSPAPGAAASTSAPVTTSTSKPATPAPTVTTQAGGGGQANPTPTALTFAAVAGAGCANTDPVYNWYTNSQDGAWRTESGGASECGGAALGMPTSGSANEDGDDYVVWWFETGPVVSGSCAVDVYVPNNANTTSQAAHYKILRGRLSSSVIAQYTINQATNRGRWVRLGTVSITGGAISVHLANRGAGGVFLGAAQARVACTT